MPYISQDARKLIEQGSSAASPGELNYQITLLCKKFIETHGLSYQHINDVLGALEGAKQEFYRRVAAPYEDKKLAAHGDVY